MKEYRKKWRLIKEAPRPQMPEAALRLAEDIDRLRWAISMLETVNEWNIADDPEQAWRLLNGQLRLLKAFLRHAESRMRREFLAP